MSRVLDKAFDYRGLEVVHVGFEQGLIHSPRSANIDRSLVDALVVARVTSGRPVCFSFEFKLIDRWSSRYISPFKDRYAGLKLRSNVWRWEALELLDRNCNQLFRSHAVATLMSSAEFQQEVKPIMAVVSLESDELSPEVVRTYRQCVSDQALVQHLTIEQLCEVLTVTAQGHEQVRHADLLKHRYAEMDKFAAQHLPLRW